VRGGAAADDANARAKRARRRLLHPVGLRARRGRRAGGGSCGRGGGERAGLAEQREEPGAEVHQARRRRRRSEIGNVMSPAGPTVKRAGWARTGRHRWSLGEILSAVWTCGARRDRDRANVGHGCARIIVKLFKFCLT
jgi:hypothetical protein